MDALGNALRLDDVDSRGMFVDVTLDETLVERQMGVVPVYAPEGWMEDAACGGIEPDPFIIPEGSPEWKIDLSKRAAKQLCRLCTVTAQCKAYRKEAGIPLIFEPDQTIDITELR